MILDRNWKKQDLIYFLQIWNSGGFKGKASENISETLSLMTLFY